MPEHITKTVDATITAHHTYSGAGRLTSPQLVVDYCNFQFLGTGGVSGVTVTAVDSDVALAADSDALLATQHAIKTYIDTEVAGVVAGAIATAAESKTIAAGAVALAATGAFTLLTIDTSGGASEDLNTISGGTARQIIFVQAANNARTVVCKDGASLQLQADFSLDHTSDKLTLICASAGVWHEITRASNSA